MAELEQLRNQINQVDERLVALLKQRFEIVEAVARTKQASGAPVFDPTRERAVLKRFVDLVANEDYQPAVAQVFTTIMDQAKQLERKKLC